MQRSIPIALAVVMVVSLAALPLAAAGVAAQAQTPDEAADEATPGERLDAAIGVQQAEVDAEVADRTFGIQIAQAETADEAAEIVADRLDEIEDRVADLDDQRADAEQKRADGDVSSGQAAADAAPIASEAAALERQAQTAAAVADELPEDVLDAHGIDVDAIEELATSASELSSGEIVDLAQAIAGESVGTPFDDDWEPGVPDDVEIPGAGGPDEAPSGNA